ncbi:hypothetical protein UFOVP67_72 [uncultured Caudovirales phage]|uniref:Uncharacterized protein n=1 Tax=uncultured Caudovirales phage TaxID=2100421 RepID=A0A6J5T990_9CAUD|nr:hypothetical protein UFOVP67_72 [uncultured Caudovirales phage]
MKPASAKQKGRILQQRVTAKILEKFPQLTTRDVQSTPMGCPGEDIKLSELASKLFPYSVECKNKAKVAVYAFYDQAKSNANGLTPLVVVNQNRAQTPLVVIALDDFLKLLDTNF